MSAGKIVSSTTIDPLGVRMVPKFQVNGSWEAGPGTWWCTSCERLLGVRPGVALVNITHRAGSVDEATDQVAFNPDGPAADLVAGIMVKIELTWLDGGGKSKSKMLFVGKVLNVGHHKRSDTMSLECLDFRHMLEEIRVIGRHIYNPDAEEENYQQGWPAHFNPGGRPNCIYTTAGKPRFAPHPDYDLEDGESPPAPSEQHNSKASYWTLSGILEYLRTFYSAEAAEQDAFPWLPRAPEWVVWPDGLGAAIDAGSTQNFDNAVGQGTQQIGGARAGRDLIAEGFGILDVIEKVLEVSDGYALDIIPGDDPEGGSGWKATLRIVPDVLFDTSKGVSLPMAGKSSTPTEHAVVCGGSFEFDARNYLSLLAGAGQLIFVERFFDTATGTSPRIEWAHSDSRFDAWRKAIVDLGNDKQAYEEACRIHQDAATCLRIKRSDNLHEWTDQGSFPLAQINRPPWPTQLSTMPAGAADFAGVRWPVWLEVKVGSTWVLAAQFDGLEILDNGIIHVPQLRQLGSEVLPYATSGTPAAGDLFAVTDGKANITMRDVRMNLAVPLDHRLHYAAKVNEHGEAEGVASVGSVVNSIYLDPSHTRSGYLDLRDLYNLWLRVRSKVTPASVTDPKWNPAPDKETIENPLYSDRDLLIQHVERRLRFAARLATRGSLEFDGYLVTSYPPGTQVAEIIPMGDAVTTGPFPLGAVVTGNRWTIVRDGDGFRRRTYLLFGDATEA